MRTAQLLTSYICMLWLIFILGFKISFPRFLPHYYTLPCPLQVKGKRLTKDKIESQYAVILLQIVMLW